MAKILLVQPVAWVQDVMARTMTKQGHEVIRIERLSQVVEELSNGHCDLLICEGTVERKGDGANLAQQLAAQFRREGRATKVMINSPNTENIREGAYFYSPTDICQSLPEAVQDALK